MRILFISHYYPPEIGAASNRIGYFAQYLAKKGHEVSVLTNSPSYPDNKIYEGYENRFTVKIENNVTVYRTKIFLSAKKSFTSRLAHYLSFVISSFVAKRKIPRPDIIFASSPPLFTGIIGVIFKKLWKTKLIIDIRDIWPESVESVGAVRNKSLLKQGEKLAKWIYKNADHITATSPGIEKKILQATTAEAGQASYPDASVGIPTLRRDKLQANITVLPNGAELDIFRPDIKGDHMRKIWNLDDKFVVLYTGNLGLAQAPEVMLNAAEILKNDSSLAAKNILFLIVGSGVFLEELQEHAQKKNLTNVIFTGPRPRVEMPQFVAASDVCIIPYKASDTFRNTFPSKMFDYMAGGKPIIINLKGEASDLIDKAECGACIEEDKVNGEAREGGLGQSAPALAEKIAELQKNPATAKHLGQNGRKFVEENYTREKIAEELSKLLASINKFGKH